MSTLNIVLLRKVLSTVVAAEDPIPSHILAVNLGVHPSTVRLLLTRARDLLGVALDATNKGYVGVKSWGCLREREFLSGSD